jgi:hypothetical protein
MVANPTIARLVIGDILVGSFKYQPHQVEAQPYHSI